MKNASFVRKAGVAGMFGGALWLVAVFVEYAYDLFQPGSGPLYVPNQLMFFVAQLCYVTVILGLIRARAAGSGWFGRISLGLFFFGWATLAFALGLSLVANTPVADALIPIGGISSTLGGLLAGIAVAAAGRLGGWPRYAPLFQGLYQASIFLSVVFVDERGPTQLTESISSGTWFLVGLALFVSARKSERSATRESRKPAEA